MAVFAVVPVKSLGVSKRRLSALLSPQERKLLTLAMLEDVVRVLQASVVRETVVVSNDPDVHEVAARFGVRYLSAAHSGLNPAIEEATELCVQSQAESVLVIPADVPLLKPRDIDCTVGLGSDGETVVLSPSSTGGTNVLFRKPPNAIAANFGPRSFVNHFREARRRGLRVRFFYSVGTGTDIDSAEDLKKLFEVQNNTLSKHVLEQMQLRSRRRRLR
ncbi:MAG: 2-phospho-L-lactate guanylyltransferase [Candidatus Bathyarchaeia archaeon]